MRNRTLARRLALQFLYMLDLRGPDVMKDLDDFLLQETDKEEVRAFARRLIEGTMRHREELDRRVIGVAHNWRLERMAAIDRNVLRMAVYELLYDDEIPPIVSINEAIELAKEFSTEKSSSFVNGILDKINLQVQAERGGPSKAAE